MKNRILFVAAAAASLIGASSATAATVRAEAENYAPLYGTAYGIQYGPEMSNGARLGMWSPGYIAVDLFDGVGAGYHATTKLVVRTKGMTCVNPADASNPSGKANLRINVGYLRTQSASPAVPPVVVDRLISGTATETVEVDIPIPGGVNGSLVGGADLAFTNDYVGNGCDRNLTIDYADWTY